MGEAKPKQLTCKQHLKGSDVDDDGVCHKGFGRKQNTTRHFCGHPDLQSHWNVQVLYGARQFQGPWKNETKDWIRSIP
jgi:hypothetical protein